jgi:hypothetical protein
MKHSSTAVVLAILGLLAAISPAALPSSAAALGPAQGASYVITVYDSTGNFASRGVITLHADHTMSVIDSNQGGPAYFFSSQLGAWKAGLNGKIVAKAIDFDYPPDQDVARLDYTIGFTQKGNQAQGTITVTTFPLENGDPLDGGGTLLGTFTFVGQLVKP